MECDLILSRQIPPSRPSNLNESLNMSEENPSSNRENTAAANLDSAKTHAREAAENLKAAAEAKARELRQRAESKANEFRTTAQGKVNEFRDRAEHTYEDARGRARTWQEDGEAFVREKPLQAVFAAAAAGFVLALMCRH